MQTDLKERAKDSKALFFDIDGTLYSNRTHTVPDSAIQALRWARRQGLLLFVATGRNKLMMQEFKELIGLEFDAYITLNGQYCYDGAGSTLYKNTLNPEDVARIVQYAQSTPAPCLFHEPERNYLNLVNELVRQEHAQINWPIPEVCDISDISAREIMQIGMYLQDNREPEVLGQLSGSTFIKWISHGLDILPRGGSKRVGFERIMERFGFTREQTVTFGDSNNDIELLTYSGISVAMGNAADNVKSCADYVTGDVDKDGIYAAMQLLFGMA